MQLEYYFEFEKFETPYGPAERIRLIPAPGTATEEDVLTSDSRFGRLCELIDGVLVEKPVGYYESRLAVVLSGKGIHALQEVGILPIHGVPMARMELIGVFPTVETCLVQFAFDDGTDAFPLDPNRSTAPTSNPTDTTPPTITLREPTNAVLVP